MFYKLGIPKNFAKFTGKHLCRDKYFFIKVSGWSRFNKIAGWSPAVCNFIKKESLTQVFSYVFCEIFKNTFDFRRFIVWFDERYLNYALNVI